MVLAFLSKGLPKASRDKTENNIMQMKYLKDSFKHKRKKMAKKEINEEK